MDKHNVCKEHHTSDHWTTNFPLTIHENPAITLLIALIEENIDLAIWEHIIVICVKGDLGRIHTRLGNHVRDLGLSTRESGPGAYSETECTDTLDGI